MPHTFCIRTPNTRASRPPGDKIRAPKNPAALILLGHSLQAHPDAGGWKKTPANGGTMSFCAVCGTQHDPGAPCIGRAGEGLPDGASVKSRRVSKAEFKRVAQAADRFMVRFLLIAVVLLALVMVVAFIAHRYF
jgi:hypothetical protein